MLGIYMQRSWIVLSLHGVLLLAMFLFASSVLKFLGQPSNVAELSGQVALWLMPLHFCIVFEFPLQPQSQLKNRVIVWLS